VADMAPWVRLALAVVEVEGEAMVVVAVEVQVHRQIQWHCCQDLERQLYNW